MSASIAPPLEDPPLSGRGALTRDELFQFICTCPQALLLTSAEGSVHVMSAGAVSMLIPFSTDGAMNDVFTLFERHEPRFRALLREALVGPARRLEGLRIKMIAGPREVASWLEVSAVVFGDGCSIACHDVTRTVANEAQYRAAVAEEAHQRGKTETAAAILHDLGNVLTGIEGRAVEVRRQISDASVLENLGRAAAFLRPHAPALDAILGAQRGQALLGLLESMASVAARTQSDTLASLEKMAAYLEHAHELLSIQRTYAGAGSDVLKGKVSVARILLDVQSMAGSSLDKRGGALVIMDHAAPLPLVRVDRSKLMQVLLNLVKNAAEAIDDLPEGGAPEVVLSAVLADDGGLVIAVRDSGPGFSAEVGARLFDDGFSTKHRGSGIGLGACRKVIESFGGRLTVTSTGLGAGALALIFLPPEVVVNGQT
jgi:signal transduction histidine kinase